METIRSYTQERNYANEIISKTTISITGTDLEVLLCTKKRNRIIYTQASVRHISPDGLSRTCMLFQDYSKEVNREPCTRATAKVIELFHFKTDFARVMEDVCEFYKLEK